ncbi:hypothetical protein [Streptomyces fractus]|uniref:hypothetical protein n=1 Tax=Streptomyces fractus TaxID=641806 RepID=UPI003CF06D82
MRTALASAVTSLLNDPRAAGSPPIVQLALVVLLAKSPGRSSVISIQRRDFAGWLGCSISYLAHTVLPQLVERGLVKLSHGRNEGGQVTCLRLELLPLHEARTAGTGSPMSFLNQKDLATLLRVAEAVTCPGWAAPKDDPDRGATPPGFMAFRTLRNGGKGFAEDRLAALLLVLASRQDGRVRMRPGRVAAGFGRAEATLALLTGWDLEVARDSVDRLVGARKLVLDGPEGRERDRVRIPSVSEAYTRLRSVPVDRPAPHAAATATAEAAEGGEPRGCARCGADDEELVLEGDDWAQESLDDALDAAAASAPRDQQASMTSSALQAGGCDDDSGNESSAHIHTSHPRLVASVGNSLVELDGFSGSAVSGHPALPKPAQARQDHPDTQPDHTGGLARASGDGPLRGEKPRRNLQRNAFERVLPASQLPDDLAVALEPVIEEWQQLPKTSTARFVAGLVRREIDRLVPLVGKQDAPFRLAVRLHRRRKDIGGPIRDLVAWLTRSGLPRRPGCSSDMCDDGFRLDTRSDCDACTVRVENRKSRHRQRMAQASGGCWSGASPKLRAEYEAKVREAFLAEEASAVRVRRQQEAEVAVRRAQADRNRHQLARERAAQLARPCRSCGLKDSAGECPRCRDNRFAADAVREAVDLVLALRTDLDDPDSVAALSAQIETDTWATVKKHTPSEGFPDSALASFRMHMARQLRDQRKDRALQRLSQHPEVQAEADRIFRMARYVRGSRGDAHEYAAEARERATEALLDELLRHVATVRAQVSARPTARVPA